MNYNQRLKKRIMNANRKYHALLPLLKSQSVFREEKIKICKTIIRPMATHRGESWARNKYIYIYIYVCVCVCVCVCVLCVQKRSFKMNVKGN